MSDDSLTPPVTDVQPAADATSSAAPGPAPGPAVPPRRALVLGLGESGLAMARWLAREGWQLRVADTRTQPPMLEALQAHLPQAEFVGADFVAALLEGVALLALSPGLSPRAAPLAALLAQARERGLPVVGEIELFAQALAALRVSQSYAPQVAGITGTNGKTTTVRLLGSMIARSGARCRVAGNISPSALDALREDLDAGQLPAFWVLELSSFQLATTQSLACTAATVLNLTQDHLDWHGDLDDYRRAKQRIFAPTTLRILNRDDPLAQPEPAAKAPLLPDVSFGQGAPSLAGQFGLVREAGIIWLAATEPAQPVRSRRRGPAPGTVVAPAPDEDPVPVQRLMPVDALGLRGTHNALNALAALALARALGVPMAPALRALAEFAGEPHRTQTVAQVAGVDYIDDSKGTNVGATVAALQGLSGGAGTAPRLLVILGGEGKGQDFAPLAAAVASHARAVLLIGRDAGRIADALQGVEVPVQTCPSLEAAVQQAALLARPGDAVLLSPACASFDAFHNYAHRAQVFIDAVHGLAARAAEPPAAAGGPGTPDGAGA